MISPKHCVLPLFLALLFPAFGGAQEVTQRSPNLAGGWVGPPGTIHFNFNHRFWVVDTPGDDKLVNSPSFLIGVPAARGILLGAQYASNSLITPTRVNEWELFGRVSLLGEERPVRAAVTGAYNLAAESADAELSLVLPLGRTSILGSGRAFSDAMNSGDPGWFAGGGILFGLTESMALAGDVGALWVDGERAREVWGAALQIHIPTTPHTLSLQATNTRTGTLQGSAFGTRTVWGFEFTIPITLARYFSGSRGTPREQEGGPPDAGRGEGDVHEVTMTDDLRYLPETIEVRAGETVVWRNDTPLVHTVTAHPERVRDPEAIALPAGAEPFDSGDMFAGDEFRHTFTVEGEYVYLCVPHDLAGMVGRVVVVP